MQKELKDVRKAIKKWSDKNEGEVVFLGSFVSFKVGKYGASARDAILVGYGNKDSMDLTMEQFEKALKSDKKEFINW